MPSRHFSIRELVSPAVYKRHGNDAWSMLDERLIITLDAIRERFGATIVNDWAWGGSFRFRGLRSPLDVPALRRQGIYRAGSLHNVGRAADMHFRSTSVTTARKYILSHPDEFPFVKGIEVAPWLHIDVRNSDRVVVFGQ